jgi:hypothetical protein
MNVFLTGFIIGKHPECYWLFQLAKCSFYLGYMWYYRLKNIGDIFYFLEFCWVAVHLYMTFLSLAALEGFGFISTGIFGAYGKQAILIYWGIANGPLATASFLLGNAIIFHDLPNLASCFIHLTPCTTAWTMRWWAQEVSETWPDVFMSQDTTKSLEDPSNLAFIDPNNNTETFLEVVSPALTFYMVWWLTYMIFFMVFGRFLGMPQTKYDTLFHLTARDNKSAGAMFGYNQDEYWTIGPFIKYMVSHLIGATISISFSYVLWQSFWVHTAFCCSLFAYCTYNGARRYYNMMTKYYKKSLEKIANE